MSESLRYRVDTHLTFCCRVLDLSPDNVLRRARLPAVCISPDFRGVTDAEYFALWTALSLEYGGTDIARKLAMAVAHGPFFPALFAFSCSPSIITGLKRLTIFKPLIGPMRIVTRETADSLTIEIKPVREDLHCPASMAESEMILFTELCRSCTAAPIRLQALTLPDPDAADRDYFGCPAQSGQHPSMTISMADATLPMIYESPELWATFEPDLQRKLADQLAGSKTSDRLRNALLEAIPAGLTNSEEVATRMHMSKRSLQRRLSEEGTTYKSVLDKTRSDLARHYLLSSEISIDEVSHLLGFSDRSSFYRAFQSWFGTTPKAFRHSEPSVSLH